MCSAMARIGAIITPFVAQVCMLLMLNTNVDELSGGDGLNISDQIFRSQRHH